MGEMKGKDFWVNYRGSIMRLHATSPEDKDSWYFDDLHGYLGSADGSYHESKDEAIAAALDWIDNQMKELERQRLKVELEIGTDIPLGLVFSILGALKVAHTSIKVMMAYTQYGNPVAVKKQLSDVYADLHDVVHGTRETLE